MKYIIVYITCKDMEEATKISKALVQDRIGACVNILGNISSFFWWGKKVQREEEVAMIVKTRENLLNKLIERVKDMHSYECPCIVAVPIIGGNREFLSWIDEETSKV